MADADPKPMGADLQAVTPGQPPEPTDSQVPADSGSRSVYLEAYLAPFRQWLDRDTVTEIIVNRPGEVWIEDAAIPGGMQRIETCLLYTSPSPRD